MSDRPAMSPWWKSKRIKLDNRCNNNKDNNSETVSNWNYNGDSSIVEPEVLVDLGVGMLDDDTSCDSTKRTQSQTFSNSPSGISSNKRHLAAESSRLMDNKENSYRASNVDQDDDLERLAKDSCARQEDSSSSLDNESGYVTRVENETSVERQSSNLSTNSSWEEMNQFYLYRRKRRPSLGGEDKFSTLSDEIILMILKWLPKKCLVRSMLVCKRWHQIARDEALWARLDLGNKVLAPGTLGHILPRGVQIMRLAQAELPGPIINPTSEIMNDTYRCKLQYLDLSMAVIDPDSLALLLSKCRLLKKLSLEKCSLNNDCCKAISNNPDLTVLNLTMCDGIKPNGCKYLMELKKLKELNMSWSSLGIESVTEICLSLPSTVTRLNLAGCRKTMTDIDVSYLLKSCPDLKELDLSDCSLLTAESINYFTMFEKLEHLSLSRCYGIPHPSSYMKLTHMPSLLYLDIFGIMTDVALKTFSANCNNTQINKYFYSSIARPTVGIRRTSIWELRVRD